MIDDRRVHDLLGKVLNVPAADRPDWLAREIPDDPALQARLLAAVASLSLGEDTTKPSVVLNVSPPGGPSDDALVGQRLGPFVVETRLREQGGMGTVYRGRRVDGAFTQDVAIKVISRGRDTDAFLRRFGLERRVLGLLQHPNIVRILDAGAIADGRPYFVMEWVDGLPLDRFGSERQLSLAQRLALFQQLCAAVQYAHQHLVVHRDLKPGNVLVTPDGAPKILDFGLAKLLDEAGPDEALVSRTHERPMTPAYASPEQVRGEAVTTATDVHALGLILYELLTGQRPYKLTSSSPSEIERVVCEEEPELPSQASRGSSGTDGIVVAIPAKRLRGELDAIVMRALQKQPGNRYQTAAELSEDVARFLSGQPVLARRTSFAYRSGKFVKRHAKGLTAAAAVVLLAAAFVVQNTLHARTVAVERDKAQASLKFLVNLFEASDPDKAKGDKLLAVDLLDAGAKQLETELNNQPATRASLLYTIGDVYYRLGRYPSSERLLVESVDLQRQLSNRPTLELADALNALGRVIGTKRDVVQIYNESLAIRRQLLPPDDPLIGRSLNNIAILRMGSGDLAGAAASYREALAIHRLPDRDRAISLLNFSSFLFRQDKYAESVTAARESWEIAQKVLGPDNTVTITALAAVSWGLSGLGEYLESERVYRDVVERTRRLYGDAHLRVAEAYYTHGTMLSQQHRLDEAEAALRAAKGVWDKLPGIADDRVAWTLSGLGGVLAQKGRYAEAETYLREALELRQKKKHPDVAESLGGLGSLYFRTGKLAEAEKYFRMNLDMLLKVPGLARSTLAYPETGLGRLLAETGRLEEAESLLRHGLEGLRLNLPAGHPRIAYAEVLLGDCLTRRGRFDEAKQLLDSGVTILRTKESGAENTRYAEERLAALSDAMKKSRPR